MVDWFGSLFRFVLSRRSSFDLGPSVPRHILEELPESVKVGFPVMRKL